MPRHFKRFHSKFGSLRDVNNYTDILFLQIISFPASPWISEVLLNYILENIWPPGAVETPWIVAQLQTCLNVLTVLMPPGTCDYIIRADRNLWSPHIHTVWYRASSSWASDTWGSSSSTVINICMTLNKSFVFSESQCLCCKGEITIFIILLLILHYNDIWYVVCYFIILTILLCLISLLWGANETMFVKLLCKGWKIIKMKMEYLEK